jgi:predicted nucleic acid-binding protein
LQVIQAFISTANVIDLHEEIIVKTSELRRSGLKIKLPDGIIAATALVHGLTLLTRNISDFKQVPGLQLNDPFQLKD